MGISSVSGVTFNKTRFLGHSARQMVLVEKEEDVHDCFRPREVSAFGRHEVLTGDIPIKRIEGSIEPCIILTGSVYYADWDEWTGDKEKETHSAVVVDRGRHDLTEERIKENDLDTPEDVLEMIKCIDKDLLYHEDKIYELSDLLEDEKNTDEIERLKGDISLRKQKIEHLKHLKAAARASLDGILTHLKEHNCDYFAEKRRSQQGLYY